MNKILIYTIVISLLSPIVLWADDAKIKRFKNSFDKNSDGHISKDEYVSTREKWGKPVTESERFFKYHDKNKDGKITLEEFLASK